MEGSTTGDRPAPAAEADALRPAMLGDQIKDRLLTMIMEGELPPGTRIVETRIARELGASQAPVREALRDLAQLGFVELQPYKGARVRRHTVEEHIEAIEVRAELEAMAAREVAGKLTGAQLAQMRAVNDEMRRLIAEGDVHGHALKNTEFHSLIVQASSNRTLRRIWEMVQPFAQTYYTVSVAGAVPGAYDEDRHLPILEALIEGDPERAGEVMREHGRANVALLRDAQRKQQSGDVVE